MLKMNHQRHDQHSAEKHEHSAAEMVADSSTKAPQSERIADLQNLLIFGSPYRGGSSCLCQCSMRLSADDAVCCHDKM
jgi:hypothetical protein